MVGKSDRTKRSPGVRRARGFWDRTGKDLGGVGEGPVPIINTEPSKEFLKEKAPAEADLDPGH